MSDSIKGSLYLSHMHLIARSTASFIGFPLGVAMLVAESTMHECARVPVW
jgi:hypothetical protein